AAIGAALTGPVSVELIADTFHIHPGLFPLCAKLKGSKLILITDCIRAGGMPDGAYELGGQKILVRGIESRLSDGTIAGSVLRLNGAVRNMRAHTGLAVHEVVNMASLNPATAIGEPRKGSLAPGKDADIILCDEDFDVHRTISRGETIYHKR
ncbi:MAG: amidohydrolase family protein, partial [Clostridia bacterium]|nr:amidohydrolase family protein [Clostridia bacterium]